MVSIDQQDHGGTASIVAIYSIPLHFARAMIAIRSVATVGVADMIDVLEPLKIGYCHSAGIGVCIRDDHNTLVDQNLLCLGSGGAIGCFGNDFGLNPRSILMGELAF